MEMHIAICDDENEASLELKTVINQYFTNDKTDIFIDIFNNGEDLIKSSQKFELIFLDVEMTGLNGMDVVKKFV